MSGNHQHETRRTAGGPDDGAWAFDWFAALDVIVWTAVGLIIILGVEWLIGKLMRESVSRAAQEFLAKTTTGGHGQIEG